MLERKHTIRTAHARRLIGALGLVAVALGASACFAFDEGRVIREDDGRTVTRITMTRTDPAEARPAASAPPAAPAAGGVASGPGGGAGAAAR